MIRTLGEAGDPWPDWWDADTSALDLQVMIEDYVHSGAKFALIIAVRLGSLSLRTAGSVDTLRIPTSVEGSGARAQKSATSWRGLRNRSSKN
jgi:hypothetical protein